MSLQGKETEMNRHRSVLLGTFAIAGAIAAVPVLGIANDAMNTAPGEASRSAANLPPEQVQGKVSFISGGIGSDEAAAMRREEAKYPLSLEFVRASESAGAHLSGVNVTIRNKQGGTDLRTVAGGPFLLAKLPPGDYSVTAEHNGQAKTQNVVIAANKPERVVFVW
jgi:hypothetical protein